MKELTREVTTKEITGYEANDGTIFCSKEECEKYEQTSDCVIKAAFEKLVIAENNEFSLFDGYGCGSDEWRIVLIHINNAEELKTANMYSQITVRHDNRFDENSIGKELIVGVGDGYGGLDCWVYGTVDELTEKFRADMKERLKPNGEQEVHT